MYSATTATKKVFKLDKRIQAAAGGTSASKTISILLKKIHECQTDKTPKLTSVVSETMPHLKRGAMRDFLNIMQQHGYYRDERWNRSDYIYTFETGSKMEFFSTDSPDKVRGPRRDRLYINEANNVPFEAYQQLEVRTKETICLDWNPTNEFWFYTEVLPNPLLEGKIDFITLTYRDNEALDPQIVESIESRRMNKAWWRVYGEGLLGEVEGKIFTGWKIIDEVPHEARLEVRGGDFGFARDRTAFCDIYYYNGGYIIDELVSRVGLKDTDLANLLLNQPNPHTLTIADSADAQKILIMADMGVNIIGVEKKGSGGEKFTNAAIGFVQDQKISITKRSLNYIKSYRNFMWQTDRDGRIIAKYDHYNSDEMMSVVYGMTMFNPSNSRDDAEITTTGNFAKLWT